MPDRSLPVKLFHRIFLAFSNKNMFLRQEVLNLYFLLITMYK